MKVAVPTETTPGERLVALTPDAVPRLVAAGFDVVIEAGAGEHALFQDEEYRQAGAAVASQASDVYANADVVLKVRAPDLNEVDLLPPSSTLIGFLSPMTNADLIRGLEERGLTSFSMDTVPRIARAQSMDALTSLASVAGYKAVLIAANQLTIFLPMMITAAGTMPPAKGLVMGAGVAGLQAIATGRRLGAVMYGYDIRLDVKEQVLSLGARFVESDVASDDTETVGGYASELGQDAQGRERELVHQTLKDMDFVITTAAVAGRPAPLLITEEMVGDMKPGAVIVDVAAESGGNCALTQPGDTVMYSGVMVCGPLNLPSAIPRHASQIYSRNVSNLLLHLTVDGRLYLDFEDEITRSCCITHKGSIVHKPTLDRLKSQSVAQKPAEGTL